MTPYDDLVSPAHLHDDCEQVGRNLGLAACQDRRLARAAASATRPAPSIHFADYPREVGKRDIAISEAAARSPVRCTCTSTERPQRPQTQRSPRHRRGLRAAFR